MKGAPEIILGLSKYNLTHDGPAELGEDEREDIDNYLKEMAGEPLRVIGLAYTEMSVSDWEGNFGGQDGEQPERILEEALQSDQLPLTFIGNFGLRD